ncbi:MAG: transporter [Mesorhizobium amorphae]|nr:MAG: transporter [Mesorhizobium amorphae]
MLSALHVEGTGLLHRLGARTKLAALAISGALLFLVERPVVLAVLLAIAAGLYLTAGLPISEALRRLRWTLVSIALLAALNLFLLPPGEVLTLTLRILALVFLAAAVTATTPLPLMIGAVNRFALPLERLGLVRRGDLGLMVGLAIRFVPEIASRANALAEAHKARGLKLRPHTLIGPLVIQTLREADAAAAAIDARGLRAPPRHSQPRRPS